MSVEEMPCPSWQQPLGAARETPTVRLLVMSHCDDHSLVSLAVCSKVAHDAFIAKRCLFTATLLRLWGVHAPQESGGLGSVILCFCA